MNLLLKARRSLDGVFKNREAIISKLIKEGRDALPAERDRLDELNRERGKWEHIIADIDEHRANPHKHPDPGSEEDPRFFSTSVTHSVSAGKARSFRSLFGADESGFNSGSDFRNLGEMVSVIFSGRHDPRLMSDSGSRVVRAAGGASKITGAGGGWLVPEPLILDMLDTLFTTSIILSRAHLLPVQPGSDSKLLVQFDGSDRSSGSIFGFSTTWVSEDGTAPIQKPKLRTTRLTPKKAMILSAISNELLEDCIAGGSSAIEDAILLALKFSIDRCLIRTGTGAGSPLSLLNMPSRIVVSKGDTPSGSISYGNICDMESRLLGELDSKAIWICSPSCKAALMQLSVVTIEDVAASHIPALVQQGGKWTLNGRELVFSEHASAIGFEGDLILCDLDMCAVAIARDFRIDRSDGPYFGSDELALRSTIRIDSNSRIPEAVLPSGGGPSLSWCVTLQTR